MNKNDGLWRITLDTNPDHCNLNCIMCEDHSKYSDKNSRPFRKMMPENLMESVIRQGAEFGVKEIIPSTMGEPLLYNHFDKMISLCHELDLKLNLTTNGTFPYKGQKNNVDYWAENIIPIGSDIKISWNGAGEKTQEEIMVGTKLSSHIENTRKLTAIRDRVAKNGGNYCSLTLQLTFMEKNVNEIPALVRMAIDLGFDRVKGHHLWAHFPEIKDLSLRRNKAAIEKWNQCSAECARIVYEKRRDNDNPVKLENFFPLSLKETEDIAPGGACPFLGKEAWIDHSGRFNVCCAPDKKRKALGYFGNIEESSLEGIWKSHNYKSLLENYMEHPLCKSCNMRKPVS